MFVTDCCQSPEILQDAYVDPNTKEIVSEFDDFICDNQECSNYGGETWCRESKEEA